VRSGAGSLARDRELERTAFRYQHTSSFTAICSRYLFHPRGCACSSLFIIFQIVLQEKAVEATKQKEEKRKKPKPEEQEGMPPRQYSSLRLYL
jgi:hypothetical protein